MRCLDIVRCLDIMRCLDTYMEGSIGKQFFIVDISIQKIAHLINFE